MKYCPLTCRWDSHQDLRALTTRANGDICLAHHTSAPRRQHAHKIQYLGGERPELRPKLPTGLLSTPFDEMKTIPTEGRTDYVPHNILPQQKRSANILPSQVWRNKPEIPSLRRLRHKSLKLEASLDYKVNEFQDILGYSRILSQKHANKQHLNKSEAHKSSAWWIIRCSQWSCLHWESTSEHADLGGGAGSRSSLVSSLSPPRVVRVALALITTALPNSLCAPVTCFVALPINLVVDTASSVQSNSWHHIWG